MSSDDVSAIQVEHISKYFEIYEKPSHRLWQMLCRGKKQFYRPFWALRDVSFSLNAGECVGIVGRNGAGKSTLLQIIAGTLTPSSGDVRVRGRLAALLELGSGFNPEFTGRENVFLNAALLGLTQQQIEERYDRIAGFADIGDFINQPVKSYSSGMIVRLAFAVVAHVDADVLIVDEALAVGDAFFTQKCMRFLRNFITEHTVLFVSHDIAAVNSLCNRAIFMEQGMIKLDGTPKEVTEAYLEAVYASTDTARSANDAPPHTSAEASPSSAACGPSITNDAAQQHVRDMRADFLNASNLRNDIQVFKFNEQSAAFGQGGATITNAALLDKSGAPLSWIVGGEPVTLHVTVTAHKDIFSPIVGFFLRNRLGQNIFGDNTYLTYRESPLHLRQDEQLIATFSFDMPILEAGDYTISIAVAEGSQEEHVQHDWKHDALVLKSVSSSCSTGLVGIPMRHIALQVCSG